MLCPALHGLAGTRQRPASLVCGTAISTDASCSPAQAHLLTLIEQLMNECIPKERHCRDYLAKFPEELLVDNLGNHVLFAAEVSLR